MTALAPLAAYDIRDGSYCYPHHGPFRDWCAEQGIDVDITVRVEIHLIDTLFARVAEHELDEEGRVVFDREREEIRMRTRDVLITCEPPQGPIPTKVDL